MLCGLAKENPESAAELQHVSRVLPRIHRKLKIPCEPEPVPSIPEFELRFEGPAGVGAPNPGRANPGRVEYYVRDHEAATVPTEAAILHALRSTTDSATPSLLPQFYVNNLSVRAVAGSHLRWAKEGVDD